MPLRSTVTINVDDEKFRAFTASFNKYEQALKKMPGAWGEVGKEHKVIASSFEKMTAAMMAQAEMVAKIAHGEKESERLARSTASMWTGMLHSTRGVASNIAEATRHLLRWSTLAGAVGGLLGAGGLWGLDRLSGAIASNARSSRSLGVSYGAKQAFEVDFGQMVQPDAFLANVSDMMNNLNASSRFAQMGVGYAGRAPDAVAIDMMKKIREVAKNSNPAMLRQALDIAGLQSVSLEEARSIGNTPDAVFNADIARYPSDKKRLGLGEDTQDAFTLFMQQLRRAGKDLEKTIGVAVKPLIPSLQHLSSAFDDTVRSLLSAPEMKKWVTDASSGLEHLAKWMSSPAFQTDLTNFEANIKDMADKVGSAIQWVDNHWPMALGGGPKIKSNLPTMTPAAPWLDVLGPKPVDVLKHDQFLSLVRQLENSGDTAVSPKGAVGRYQVLPSTARSLGFDPTRLKDPAYNKMVASAYLTALENRYHENWQDVIAAYNAGPTKADRYAAAGNDSTVLPAETRAYLDRATRLLARVPPPTDIHIHGLPAGSTATISNQLAKQIPFSGR